MPLAEIEANGWDLNIGRYIKGAAAEVVDVETALAELAEAQAGAARGGRAARGAAGRGRLCVTAGDESARRSRRVTAERRAAPTPSRPLRPAGVRAHAGHGLVRPRIAMDGLADQRSCAHRFRSGQLVDPQWTPQEVPSRATTGLDGCVVTTEFPTIDSPEPSLDFPLPGTRLPLRTSRVQESSHTAVQAEGEVWPSELPAIEMDFPPLAEQRRIVDLIGAVDAASMAATQSAADADAATGCATSGSARSCGRRCAGGRGGGDERVAVRNPRTLGSTWRDTSARPTCGRWRDWSGCADAHELHTEGTGRARCSATRSCTRDQAVAHRSATCLL